MAKKPPVFVREATGLVREVSPTEVGLYLIAASGPLTVGMAYTLSWWLSNYPRVDLVFAFIVAIILTFCFSGAAALLASAMPRSGGDYVFLSRTIHPALGFLGSWNMFVYNSLAGVPILGSLLLYAGIGPMLYVIGSMMPSPSLVHMGETTIALPWSFIIVMIFIVGTSIILLFGIKMTVRATVVLVILAWVCLLFGMLYPGSLASASHADFVSRFNQYALAISGKSNAYDYIINTARSFGYETTTEPYIYSIASIMGMAGLCSMAVTWQWTHVYFSGEIKRGGQPRRQLYIITIPLISHIFGMLLPSWLLIRLAGGEFLNAYNYLSVNHGDALPFAVTAGGYLNFLLGMAAPNLSVAVILNLSMVFAALGWSLTMYAICTRSMFAWSFDRLFPSWIADVNERLHTPLKATLIYIFLNMAGAVIYTFWPDLVLPILAAAGAGCAIFSWIPISITAIIFPRARRDIYRSAPVRTLTIGPVPVMSILGAVGLFFTIYIGYAFWIATLPVGQEAVILVSIVGLVIYFLARWYRKGQGIDLSLTFKELPPE